jgi:hypothetical protein
LEAGGWKAQAEQLNDFGAAYHRMQTCFEDRYGLYVQELKAVEQCLVEARARTRVHAAMVQLISQKQLGGCHYWMGLPGFNTHPCPDVLPDPPHFTMAKDLECYACFWYVSDCLLSSCGFTIQIGIDWIAGYHSGTPVLYCSAAFASSDGGLSMDRTEL